MDSVYVVNNYIESGGMDITQWIQIITTIVIAFFAYKMWRNAQAVKKLEETNQKIAMWPEIKQFIAATHKFVFDISSGKIPNLLQIHNDYFTELQLARYYFHDDDVLFKPIMKLITIGKRLYYLWGVFNKSADPEKRKETVSEIKKNAELLFTESEKIDKILRDRYDFSIPIEKS